MRLRLNCKRSPWLPLLVLLPLLYAPAARAQAEAEAQPEPPASGPVALAEAYQSGYLQLLAISCFQLYSSLGIIATDFADGYIDTEAAIGALDYNSLLHSACYTTLAGIQELTPAEDTVAQEEFARLRRILEAQMTLLDALGSWFSEPTDENGAAAEAARAATEAALNAYTGESGA